MQPILEKLYRAESMSQQESQQLFSAIVRGELEPSQLAAALISMKVRGERPEEIAGAAKALLDDAQPFPRPDYPFADIVGTGGDGTNSINISTASAFVAAACARDRQARQPQRLQPLRLLGSARGVRHPSGSAGGRSA